MKRGFGESVDALSCTAVYIKKNLQMCKLCVYLLSRKLFRDMVPYHHRLYKLALLELRPHSTYGTQTGAVHAKTPK